MMGKTRTAKVGRYHAATVENLHDGHLRDQINALIARMMAELDAYERATSDLTAKVSATVSMQLKRHGEEHFDFGYTIQLKVPKRAEIAMVRGAGGKLLIDPDDDLNDKQQMTLPTYDRFGQPGAVIDPTTGEVLDDQADDGAVAGKVNAG